MTGPAVPPRRMRRLFEFDHRGGMLAGTPGHQTAVRDWFDRHATFDAPVDRVLQRIAAAVKRGGTRFYVSITFDVTPPGVAAYTFPHHVVMSPTVPAHRTGWVLAHEIGHLFDFHVMTAPDRVAYLDRMHAGMGHDPDDWRPAREPFAHDFRAWVYGADDPTMTAILLSEAAVDSPSG